MVRKRDRLRGLFRPDSPSPSKRAASPHTAPSDPSPPQTSTPPTLSPPSPHTSFVSIAGQPGATISQSAVLVKALQRTVEKLPTAEKTAFTKAFETIDERSLLTRVRSHDAAHKDQSSFRPHAERLSKFLSLLDRFMGGVATGIQHSPEISSLVVGSVRLVIDLALKFTTYFSRLIEMICTLDDYLEPLAEYAKAADFGVIEGPVVNAYASVLTFSWKARRVFIDANGDQRKWTSARAFMHQHWDTFESEFVSIKEDLQHHLDVLRHAVPSLHFNFARQVEQARRIQEAKKERSAFLNWVSGIDFEQTHQDTFAKKHEQTGDWLLREPKYEQWFSSAVSSLLWCNGKPGIGKSVLASNVIEDITTRIGPSEDAALCFAYYNYRDTQLKDSHQVVTALIKQLCRRREQLPLDLLRTKEEALPQSLVGTQERFVSLVEDLSAVYIVLDALDECPEEERGNILGFITGIVTAQIGCRVRVFVTSRPETDITRAFEDYNVPTVQILAENVTADIETFARSQVKQLRDGKNGKTLFITDDSLEEKIVQTLASKAQGMFLWVNLQLDNLCQASRARRDTVVEAALATLPRGLEDTYIRILDRIEAQSPYLRDLAFNCLAWTIHARRPLWTEELQHAVAVNLECKDLENMEVDSRQVILEACGNLLEEAGHRIRPIHYTVQEFFTTAAQSPSNPSIWAQLFNKDNLHTRLALRCLEYIRLAAFAKPVTDKMMLHFLNDRFPFAAYACSSFDHHISQRAEPSRDVIDEVRSLLRQKSPHLAAILQIRLIGNMKGIVEIWDRFNSMNFDVNPATIVHSTSLYDIRAIQQEMEAREPPLYALHLAASAGLTSVVVRLLDLGCVIDEHDNNDCDPLYHACSNGEVDIARLLLNRGTDVNAMQGGTYGSSLKAASHYGHAQVVRLLLDHNVDVNLHPQDTRHLDALQEALSIGNSEIARTLLDRGAAVNAQGGYYGNALQAASSGSNAEVVTMLLDRGADVNAQGGYHGNALQAASYKGEAEVVTMLLDRGADVNAQSGYYRSALQAASYKGHAEIAMLLLDRGAKVNAQGGHYGNALQAASYEGEAEVVTMLLDRGADVNAQGGHYGNALQAALFEGEAEVVTMLLDRGADINAQGGHYGNALQAASLEGNVETVKMLLDRGAEVNAQGGYYGNALQAASQSEGGIETVKLLLDKGADVNAQGGEFGNALQAASGAWHESVELVSLLLDKGANINANGPKGTALQLAAERKYRGIVGILIDRGADVMQMDLSVLLYSWRSGKGGQEIVEMLIDKGANVNAGGPGGTALHIAVRRQYKSILRLLLDAGAERSQDNDLGDGWEAWSSSSSDSWTDSSGEENISSSGEEHAT